MIPTDVSIHSFQAEGDLMQGWQGLFHSYVSIHSFQAEGDMDFCNKLYNDYLFQSTPSKRKETTFAVWLFKIV